MSKSTDSKILLLATDEDTSTNTSVSLPLGVIYSAFNSSITYNAKVYTDASNLWIQSIITGDDNSLTSQINTANTFLQANDTITLNASKAYASALMSANLTYNNGVNGTQNTTIQLAWGLANTSLQNTSTILANNNVTVPGTLSSNNHFNNYTIYTSNIQANTSVNTASLTSNTIFSNTIQANTSVNTSILTAALLTTVTVNTASINTTGTVNVGGPILFGSGSITAAGASNTSATLVSYDNTYIGGGTGGVILPTAVVGREISITNSTANTITVYPNSGASIELLFANQGVSLPPYATLAVVAKTTTNWWATTYIFTPGTDISLAQGGSGSITISANSTLNSVLNRGNVSSSNITVNAVQSNTSITTANLTYTGIQIIQPQYFTLTANSTITLPSNTSTSVLIIANNQPSVTMTVNMPTGNVNGQICGFSVVSNNTNLLLGTGGPDAQTFIGLATAGSKFRYVYNAPANTWYTCP